MAVCKREVASLTATTLTSAEKVQLAHVCAVAGSGNRTRLRAAEKQICLTVIKDSAPGLTGPVIRAEQQSCDKL